MEEVKTIPVWSKSAQALVDFTINREEEEIAGIVHIAIVVRNPQNEEEVYRFSPNCTQEEITKQVTEINTNRENV